jgi:glucose-6-phosphate isomerase
LHQGQVIPADFIGFIKSQTPIELQGDPVSNHDELMSAFFSQPDALAFGKQEDQLQVGCFLFYLNRNGKIGRRSSGRVDAS